MRSQGCIKKKKKLFRGGIRRVGWEFEILKTLARKKQRVGRKVKREWEKTKRERGRAKEAK